MSPLSGRNGVSPPICIERIFDQSGDEMEAIDDETPCLKVDGGRKDVAREESERGAGDGRGPGTQTTARWSGEADASRGLRILLRLSRHGP